MNKNNKKIELLAPAGNYQSFMAAINNGADAIYLGLSEFNARGNIENFTRENLKETVEKAHFFGVKIYLTLNTLLKDEEIPAAIELVRFAIDCKVDAFIVQDIGLIYLLRNKFENIELHASTQMGIENIEGVKFLSDMGFTRVVLARETPLSEIRRIKENCAVDIEYFIQGALCVGYSGNCYLCSILSGASGNRGKCKQFCRLKYQINDGKEGYYLSAKDFCMLPMLKELSQSGVTSLKIEGRARRAGYVGEAVYTYRKAIDNAFKYGEEDLTNLKKVFNRGEYIPGYLNGEKVIYSKLQNHIGVKIGRVLAVKRGKRFNEITINSSHNLQAGDTIKLFEGEREVVTISPVDIKVLGKNNFVFTTTSIAKEGMEVRLIVDGKLEEEVLKRQRKLGFSARISAKIGKPMLISMSADNQMVEVRSDEVLSEAKSSPLSEEDCRISLSKCGEEFMLKTLDCDLENVFLRKSELNSLRRTCLEKLRAKIIESHEKKTKIVEKDFILNSTEFAPKIDEKIIFFEDENGAEKCLKDFIEKGNYFVFSPPIYDKNKIAYIAEKFEGKDLYLDMPVIVNEGDVLFLKEILKDNPNLGVYANNYYALSFVSPDKTIVGSEMNIFNSYTVEYYSRNGFKKLVISKENFDFEGLKSDENVKLFVEEKAPRLIYFKHCPIREHFGGKCDNCKYREGIIYTLGKEKMLLKRKKVISCHFYLKSQRETKKSCRYGKVIEM